MSSRTILLAAALLTSACSLNDKKEETSSAPTALPSDCEKYLAQYSCFLSKTGKSNAEADQLRADWRRTAAVPQSRIAVATSCAQQLVVQQDNFQRVGCGPGAGSVPLQK